jgi:hypothetical protein
MPRAILRLTLGILLSVAAGLGVRADDLTSILDRVGSRVSEYYSSAQNILAEETMRIQPETRNMTPEGFARVLVYDVHLEWTPPDATHEGEASIVRQLLKVNGRPPKPGDKDNDEKCMDPAPISPEPLTMLLPAHRGEYTFTLAGSGKTDGRASIMIDYRERVVGKPVVKWKDDCVSVDLPGRFRGRLWLDAITNDVIRMDEELVGRFSVDVPPEHQLPMSRNTTMTLEQVMVSTKYQVVTFKNPDETLIVPRSVDTSDSWNGAGYPRVRVTQTFANYRRFTGESRLVATPADR